MVFFKLIDFDFGIILSGLYLHLHGQPMDLEILIVMIITGKVLIDQKSQKLSMEDVKFHA